MFTTKGGVGSDEYISSSAMTKQVLHILGTAHVAGTGIAKVVASLAEGLDPKRYRLDAWFMSGHGPLADDLERLGVSVKALNLKEARSVAGAWRLWNELRREHAAIIHLHLWSRKALWIARAAGRSQIVLHVHGYFAELGDYLPCVIPTWGARAVIANSNATAKWVRGIRAHVVYPGIHVTPDQNAASDRTELRGRVIGVAGRLVPVKGIAYLLLAAARLSQEFSDLSLEIAGSGPLHTSLQDEVRHLGLAGRVKFLGWKRDLTSVMRNWDILVQPSLEESLGLTVLEAMGVGLPVVATRVGGLPELVLDNRTGFLVPPRDPTSLEDRLRFLLLNPEERVSMGAAGRCRAREHFSIQRMVGTIEEIYDGLS